MTIAIIEFGMGNIKSVENAFCEIGADVIVTREPKEIEASQALVLPGVGAFRKGMENLERFNLIEVLQKEVVDRRKMFLGICLGMQLIALEGQEHGITKGLSWMPGKVVKIEPEEKKFRIPHMGWNDLNVLKAGGLFDGLGSEPVCYFVHSYSLEVPEAHKGVIAATCWHGKEVTAAIQDKNMFGVQFHPEKSQRAGLKMLDNFVKMARRGYRG